MKLTIIKSSLAIAVALASFTACNKAPDEIQGMVTPPVTGNKIGETIAATPTDSLYYRLVLKAGEETLSMLNDSTRRFTLFMADNAAMKIFINGASGGLIPIAAPDAVFSGFIQNNIPQSTARAIVRYNTVSQVFKTSAFNNAAPNFQLPTMLLANETIPFSTLRIYPFKNPLSGVLYANNIPMTTTDVTVANGVIHRTAVLVTPPQRLLWDRANTDADMTIFKAAVLRADSGYYVLNNGIPVPNNPQSLIGAMQNFGANLTVFAPSNQALKNFISFITGGAIPTNAPDAVYIGFLGSNNVSSFLVRAIVANHILPVRGFSVNIPATETMIMSLADTLRVQATFSGPNAIAVSVRGDGNPVPVAVQINPRPDPVGSSDQNFVNGIIHKTNGVLIPR